MQIINKQSKELDLHRIQLRFAHMRLQKSATWQRLLSSIGQVGQKVPVVVVPDANGDFILLDGYLRVKALQHCRQDTVMSEIWECDPQHGLLQVLAGLQQRPWEAIEEAYLLQELINYGMTPQAISAQIGRDPSFISRRLQLLSIGSDELLTAITERKISAWAGSRILAPLARANMAHATHLIAHLQGKTYSTRQLQQFYVHYQNSNKTVRERMVANPDLFLQSLENQEKSEATQRLASGPEGEWKKILNIMMNYLGRLETLIPIVLCAQQIPDEQQKSFTQFERFAIKSLTLIEKVRKPT